MAMKPITLTAQQAQELHTTGPLTGYREKCEWQPPESFFDYLARLHLPNEWELKWRKHPALDEFHYKYLTPPRDTATTYAVKEPWKFAGFSHEDGRTCSTFFFSGEVLPADLGDWRPAEELPDGQERQHARITDRKLIIHDGELWWDMDLEKL